MKDVVLAITYKCNSRCVMCDIWKREDHSSEITPNDILNLPNDLEDINISGGEPFLRADLPEIIMSIRKACPKARIIISSNGFATDLIVRQMKKIAEIYPEIGIAISIDGIGEEHEKVRGINGGYASVLNTIQELKKIKIKNIKIGFTLGDYNIGELKKVYHLSRDLGVEFSCAVVHSSENYFGKENKHEKKEEMARALDWLIQKELKSWSPKRWGRAYFAYGLKMLVLKKVRILPDYSGFLNCFIDPRGNIYPCDMSTVKMGNLKYGFDLNYEFRDPAVNWMVCTARQAMKKHKLSILLWALKNKLL